MYINVLLNNGVYIVSVNFFETLSIMAMVTQDIFLAVLCGVEPYDELIVFPSE